MTSLTILGYESSCNTFPFGDHATFVANIVAGNSDLSGVAPQATVLSACADAEGLLDPSLNWAFDQGANTANISMAVEANNQLGLSDRVVDYVTRQRNKFVSVGAGNGARSVGSPAKAYNITAVGAFLDKDSMTWNDDKMWRNDISSGSAFGNPASNANDREKPEVVAVGEITSYFSEGMSFTDRGTSYASPQVAGLATLLINVNNNLAQWPEAIKAIIMASSIHNIEGEQFIPAIRSGDYRDGAGALVGTLARDIAGSEGTPGNWFPCSYSCWWGIEANNDQVPVGNSVGGRILVAQGQRVRIVASWWANAVPTYHYGLETDFDLYVKKPDNVLIASSLSLDNNYEMVDFIAPVGGLYRIEVKKYAANELYNKVGIAALVYDQQPFLKNKTFIPLVQK